MHYPIVIHKDLDSDYGVTVPDLPGCFTVGETAEDALTQAAEAIECHIEGLLLDDDPIPTPKDITFYQCNPNYDNGIWKSVAINLSGFQTNVGYVNSPID